MKKLCFVLVFLVFTSWAYPVELKIMAGADLSKSTEPLRGLWSEIYAVSQYGAGFVVGGGIEFTLTRNIALEVDGLFFQKGCRLEWRYWDEVIGHSIERMNELSFPVLLKLYLRPGTSPYLLGGGEFAFALAKQSDPTYLRYTPQAAALKVLGGAISARKT